MQSLDIRKRVDLGITTLIIFLLGIGLIFKFLNIENRLENYIMLLILVVIMIISYYTNMALALLLTLIVDFTYISIKLFYAIGKGVSIPVSTYFWIIIIVIAAMITSYISKNILYLQKELTELKERNNKLIMIDHETGMRNARAFMNELPIYISMTKRRREIPVTVMIVNIKYSDRLKKLIGNKRYKDMLLTTSKITSSKLRDEDRKYILNEYTFAYILLSSSEGANIIKGRLKDEINKVTLDEDNVLGGINLEIQVGFKTWDEDIKNSLDFLRKAESEVEYDV